MTSVNCPRRSMTALKPAMDSSYTAGLLSEQGSGLRCILRAGLKAAQALRYQAAQHLQAAQP